MSEHGKVVGVTPIGEGVLPSEDDRLDVESSEGEYDPGVFTQSDPVKVEADSVQPEVADVPVQQQRANNPVADPVQLQPATDLVQQKVKGGKRKSGVDSSGSRKKKAKGEN